MDWLTINAGVEVMVAIGGALAGVVAFWLKATFVSRTAFGKAEKATLEALSDLGARVSTVEQRQHEAASAEDVVELKIEIERLSGVANTLTATMGGLRDLVERLEESCSRINAFLLERR